MQPLGKDVKGEQKLACDKSGVVIEENIYLTDFELKVGLVVFELNLRFYKKMNSIGQLVVKDWSEFCRKG